MAEFRWYGHNCFRIRAKEASVLTDPVGRNTGYTLPRQTVDIVTISHGHPGHNNLAAVKPEYQVIDGPGEYELHDIFVTGIRTYHDDDAGSRLGYNTAYLIEVEGMFVCHLGDLGHALQSDQLETMAQCDILLVPAGGGPIISAELAADVVALLEPKIVIPMQYATGAGDKNREPLATFINALGAGSPEPVEKLVIKRSELTDAMRVVVLRPDGEA